MGDRIQKILNFLRRIKKDPVKKTKLLEDVRNQKPARLPRVMDEKIQVLSIEQNGATIRDEQWDIEGAGALVNRSRGKAADVGRYRPIKYIKDGKIIDAYLIDGDRGIGVKIDMDELVYKITNSAEEAWAYLESAKFAKTFTEDLTNKQRIIMILVGFFLGQVVFWFFHI